MLLSRRVRVLDAKTVGADGSHLKLMLKDGLATWPAIAFRQADAELAGEIDIVYSLKRDWKDERVELEVLDLAPSGEHRALDIAP